MCEFPQGASKSNSENCTVHPQRQERVAALAVFVNLLFATVRLCVHLTRALALDPCRMST